MNFRAVDIADLIPKDLPDGREVVAEGKALGETVEMGLSLYCEDKGVTSERGWREIAREKKVLPESELDEVLDAHRQTEGGLGD